jgi:hypothetical protein
VNAIYNQLIPTGEVYFKVSDILKVHFLGDFVTGNSNAGDFNLTGSLILNTKFGNLSYEFQTANQEAPRLFNYYYSNHFRWANNFKKQYFIINKINFNYKNLWAGVNLFAIDNFVYFDTEALPAQLGENLQIFQASLRKIFQAGHWSFDVKAVYQNASGSDGIRVPEWIGDGSVYDTKDLFKKAAILQPGVDVLYNTSYYAYAYMPATRSFYVQNDKEIGNYFYTNVFLNLQIKRARLFLKYYNLASLFGNFNYFTVPSYPMKDGGLRFGVSWMFYN